MPTVRIKEKCLSYWTGKRGFLEKKRTVLFIHGAGGGQYTWSFQKRFFEKEFNPMILELPGHGESEGEGEREILKYAEQVDHFMNALNLQNIFLVGHSMGGAIVQTLALIHPEAIQGIVLVGTGARLKVLPLILDGIKNNFEETVQKINQFAYSRKAPLDLIEKGILGMRQCRAEVLHGDFMACDRFDVMKEVEMIHLPTLILCGEDDQLTPPKYSQFLHSQIKGSKLAVLSDAGHMVMMESPQEFNEKIREFIFDNLKGFEGSWSQGVK